MCIRDRSIGDVTVNEGSIAQLTVNLSVASDNEVSVDYASADASAIAGSDYALTSGTLVFPVGTTSLTISVTTLQDDEVEAQESFAIELSNAINAQISNASATVNVISEDVPAISINSTSVSEGDAATLTVSLSAASAQDINCLLYTSPSPRDS